MLFTVNKNKVMPLKRICKSLDIEIFEIGKTIENKKINIYQGNNKLEININDEFNHFTI